VLTGMFSRIPKDSARPLLHVFSVDFRREDVSIAYMPEPLSDRQPPLLTGLSARVVLRLVLLGVLGLGAGLSLSGCLDRQAPQSSNPQSSSTAAHHLSVADFTPAGKCGDCHVEIYRQWQTSMHSRAATDTVFWQMLPQATRDLESRGQGAGFCLKCHTPVATIAKEIPMHAPVTYPPKISAVALEGVTCDVCHTISGKENFGKDIGAGIYLYPRKGDTAVKYGTHANAVTADHLTEVASFLKSPELCAICHNFPHPFSGAVMQDTYEEWKDGPYPKMGIRCQDCHMPQYTGSGAIGAPERKDLHAHVFSGGRSDLVKKVATVTAWAQIKENSGKRAVNLKAVVTNVGSGHFMPTGLPGLRQMWLEVVVRTSEGFEVFANKSPIGIEPLGSDGKPTMPWNAVKFGKDTRIGPKQKRGTEWHFPLPEDHPDRLEVRVSVYYRSISELAAQAAGIRPSPAVEIASDRLRLFKDGRVEKIAVD
jgi:hypothetical protein